MKRRLLRLLCCCSFAGNWTKASHLLGITISLAYSPTPTMYLISERLWWAAWMAMTGPFENIAKMVTSHKDNEPCNYSSENCIFNFLGSSHQWNLQLCCKCHLCHLVWVSFYLKEIYKCIIDEIIYCLETVWPASLLFYLIICYVHSYKWHPDRFLTA